MPPVLSEATERRDLVAVAALLASGADPDAPLPRQPLWTPLKGAIEEAAEGGPVDAVVLLAAGADSSARDDEGDTPLGLCLRRGDNATAELLRLCGAVDEPDD